MSASVFVGDVDARVSTDGSVVLEIASQPSALCATSADEVFISMTSVCSPALGASESAPFNAFWVVVI